VHIYRTFVLFGRTVSLACSENRKTALYGLSENRMRGQLSGTGQGSCRRLEKMARINDDLQNFNLLFTKY
jgi:hypothetical protein